MKILLAILLLAGSLSAQDQTATADNPLATLKDEVKRVLSEAELPFTDEQDQAIVLMMEDRRKASEDLFGTLMDFSAGPTQGQDADRLRSAIDWMRNEFLTQLQNYLQPPQLAAWSRYQETRIEQVSSSAPGQRGQPPQRQQQTQFVRINNNAFTAEEFGYGGRGGGGGPEVIQRGGVGAWHGNGQFLIKDDALNAARRSYNRGVRLPTVKPPYSEHQTSFNLSGPAVPGWLTTNIAVSHNRAENVDTVSAVLANGTPFGAEIVRPTINESYSTGGTFQMTDQNSLTYNVRYAPYTRENQGIGGFVMPERASATEGNSWNVELKQFSSLSAQSIFETRFNLSGTRDTTIPASEAVQINVLDAFSGGGAQNSSENSGRNYEFSSLYTRQGERLTIKTGMEGVFRKNRSLFTNNFGGTFTFSSLDTYRAGRPINYRVNRGEPLMDITQWEYSFFLQNDWRVTERLTAMLGIRYDDQTNINDHNNVGPRVGFAYALGNATVIRGGAGFFYNRYPLNLVETQLRNDGTRQFEVFIDNPSFPDPFQAGTVRNIPPSIRVTDPDLANPYIGTYMISFERTFLSNLFVSASYDFTHEVHRSRFRNTNATYDARATVPRACTPGQPPETCLRPDPTKGNVLNLESTNDQVNNTVRLNVRKRFSIFNVTANYLMQDNHAGGAPNGGQLLLPNDNYNLKGEWVRAFNVPIHTVTSTVNAQLPLGVFVASTVSFNDGRAYNITTGKDDNMDSQVTDRAPGVPRNSGHGPKFFSVNFNISKAFFFGAAPAGNARGGGGARTNLNVFANMTNAFNHVNYAQPSGIMTSPNFGFSTNGGDPRQIEAGLRFQF